MRSRSWLFHAAIHSCAKRSASAFVSIALDVEAEVQHVAVLDDVVLALDAEHAGGAAARLTLVRDEVGVRHHLGADEAALEIGVDDRRRLRRLPAALDRPGAYFLRTGGEVAHEPEDGVALADHLLDAALADPVRLEKLGALGVVEPDELGLDLGGDL